MGDFAAYGPDKDINLKSTSKKQASSISLDRSTDPLIFVQHVGSTFFEEDLSVENNDSVGATVNSTIMPDGLMNNINDVAANISTAAHIFEDDLEATDEVRTTNQDTTLQNISSFVLDGMPSIEDETEDSWFSEDWVEYMEHFTLTFMKKDEDTVETNIDKDIGIQKLNHFEYFLIDLKQNSALPILQVILDFFSDYIRAEQDHLENEQLSRIISVIDSIGFKIAVSDQQVRHESCVGIKILTLMKILT